MLRALLECVEHVDRFIELDEVANAVLESCSHANLADPEADRWHRLPVVRFKATLNSPKLESRHLSHIGGEAAQIVSRGPEPDYGPLRYASLCKYRHARSTRCM